MRAFGERAHSTNKQPVLLDGWLQFFSRQPLSRLQHGRSDCIAGVVAGDVTAVRRDRDGLGDDVERATFGPHDVNVHERFKPSAEAALGASDPFGHRAHPTVVARQHGDYTVGLAELLRAQHDRFVAIKGHLSYCPFRPAEHPRGTPTPRCENPLMTTTRDLTSFIAGLPKAELHVHHIGSASPRIVAELAQRHPDSPVPEDPAAIADYFTFSDFAHFITVYLSVVELVRDAEDVRLLTYEVARDMAAQNIRYAELTVTPYTSIVQGVAADAFVEAIEDARTAARTELGVTLRWCFDIPGESGLPAAEATIRVALGARTDALVSFGLGGPEVGVPRPQFKPYFDQATAAGLHSVPHAGETTGPQTIWDALTHLRAERIGHGTSALQDPNLLEHLAEHSITLEVCPTSNVATRAVESLNVHPLAEFVEAGVPITINSDDPPMFGTTLNDEYQVAARLLNLDAHGVAALAKNAATASFMDESAKRELREEIDDYLTQTL